LPGHLQHAGDVITKERVQNAVVDLVVALFVISAVGYLIARRWC
jgi:hypothetical protein